MLKKNKNLKQEINEENCGNESGTIKELSDKIAMDSMKILGDIRHMIAYLGSISMEIESISTLGHMVTLGCEELDVLCHLYYNYELASDDNSSFEEFMATYSLNMCQLDDDIESLIEILPPETFEEQNGPKNYKRRM